MIDLSYSTPKLYLLDAGSYLWAALRSFLKCSPVWVGLLILLFLVHPLLATVKFIPSNWDPEVLTSAEVELLQRGRQQLLSWLLGVGVMWMSSRILLPSLKNEKEDIAQQLAHANASRFKTARKGNFELLKTTGRFGVFNFEEWTKRKFLQSDSMNSPSISLRASRLSFLSVGLTASLPLLFLLNYVGTTNSYKAWIFVGVARLAHFILSTHLLGDTLLSLPHLIASELLACYFYPFTAPPSFLKLLLWRQLLRVCERGSLQLAYVNRRVLARQLARWAVRAYHTRTCSLFLESVFSLQAQERLQQHLISNCRVDENPKEQALEYVTFSTADNIAALFAPIVLLLYCHDKSLFTASFAMSIAIFATIFVLGFALGGLADVLIMTMLGSLFATPPHLYLAECKYKFSHYGVKWLKSVPLNIDFSPRHRSMDKFAFCDTLQATAALHGLGLAVSLISVNNMLQSGYSLFNDPFLLAAPGITWVVLLLGVQAWRLACSVTTLWHPPRRVAEKHFEGVHRFEDQLQHSFSINDSPFVLDRFIETQTPAIIEQLPQILQKSDFYANRDYLLHLYDRLTIMLQREEIAAIYQNTIESNRVSHLLPDKADLHARIRATPKSLARLATALMHWHGLAKETHHFRELAAQALPPAAGALQGQCEGCGGGQDLRPAESKSIYELLGGYCAQIGYGAHSVAQWNTYVRTHQRQLTLCGECEKVEQIKRFTKQGGHALTSTATRSLFAAPALRPAGAVLLPVLLLWRVRAALRLAGP